MTFIHSVDKGQIGVYLSGDAVRIGEILVPFAEALKLRDLLDSVIPAKITLAFEYELVAHVNLHKHWRTKQEAADSDKSMLHAWWVRHGKPTPTFPCEVTFVRIAPKPFDDDNLTSAFKYMRDELCRCWGLIRQTGKQVQARDDAATPITWRYRQEKSIKPKHHSVRIEIR